MQKRVSNSQLTNFNTYNMYFRQLLTLAENVFQYKGFNYFLDIAYMNKQLLRKGSIAFFYDDVLEELIALPYVNMGRVDIYGRPNKIQVMGANGYNRTLNRDEYVIMYDNNGMYPLYLDLLQYAERLAYATRTIDINLSQQKTPRVWKTSTDKLKSVQDKIAKIDSFEEVVIDFSDKLLDDTTIVLQPAPYIADKVEDNKKEIWAEVMRLIGIANIGVQKRERMITDEVQSMQGGTIASRFSRYEPREKAIKEINKKFGHLLSEEITVEYYDGEPSTIGRDEVIEDTTLEDDILNNGGDLDV